ncbi:hypothetical protein HJC23_000536 [Cyclotella cryptica]|uniref:NlpC/P60 domain-containing protein n=1 Tax=Cyclotella cryptica TaxID=29204 RepID=A0ABD3NJ22_9STRA
MIPLHPEPSRHNSLATALVTLTLWLSRSNSALGLFVQPPFRTIKYPLTLSLADQIGAKYQGIAYDAGKSASLPGFALTLNAKFEPMDEKTFDALQRAYCGWSETKSQVKWKKGMRYTLLDFLPPLMQATSGLHFRSSRNMLKNGKLPSFLDNPRNMEQEVLLTSNCWGTAWEILYQADNSDTKAMTISTADPTSAWRAFTGTGFDLIQSSRTKPELLKNEKKRNNKLKGGDVLLVWHKNPSTVSGSDLYLDHVATLIDHDVYFEKSGSGDRVPFRLNTWEGLTRNFPTSIFFWEWRRLIRNNPLSPNLYYGPGKDQSSLKPAVELFGIDAQLSSILTSDNSKYSKALQDSFGKLLGRLRPGLKQRVSLQTDPGEDGTIDGQTYTGIVVLEDLVYDPDTGRASLPQSAYMPEFYKRALDS